MNAEELTEVIAADSHEHCRARKLTKAGARDHLLGTLRQELTAALEAAGPDYRERVRQAIEDKGPLVDRAEDQSLACADA